MAVLAQPSIFPTEENIYVLPQAVAAVLNPFRRRAGLPELFLPQVTEFPAATTSETSIMPALEIFSFGIPILELKQMFGIGCLDQPCFRGSIWDHWLQPCEASWAGGSDVNPGVYQISLGGYFQDLDWHEQENRIEATFGAGYQRASEHLLCEAFFSTWLLSSCAVHCSHLWNNPFLHWGKRLNCRGERVWIGLSPLGITVNAQSPKQPKPDLAVTISRRL